jgi:sugar (pentulose or hexulose) kinase
MTDGCASQIASGAASLGDWNTTIGTTLVIKGVTEKLLFDPKGRIYSHRHPDGHWMPGGASNVGGDCIRNNFRDDELDGLNAAVKPVRPTGMLVYPLEKKGERFPNRDPLAEGFAVGSPSSRAELYQAYLEGVAFVEKMSYEMLTSLGAVIGGTVFAAGGATKSEPWLKIRANMLDRCIAVPDIAGGSMGAAILAASISHWGSLGQAARNMVRISRTIRPDRAGVDAYREKYGRFMAEMQDRGYTREG